MYSSWITFLGTLFVVSNKRFWSLLVITWLGWIKYTQENDIDNEFSFIGWDGNREAWENFLSLFVVSNLYGISKLKCLLCIPRRAPVLCQSVFLSEVICLSYPSVLESTSDRLSHPSVCLSNPSVRLSFVDSIHETNGVSAKSVIEFNLTRTHCWQYHNQDIATLIEFNHHNSFSHFTSSTMTKHNN